MRTSLNLLALVVLAGCQPEPSNPPPGSGSPSGSPVGSPAGTPAGTPGGTDSTPTTVAEFDCSTIPTTLTGTDVQPLGAPRGYHDLAFTLDGFIIGNDNGNSNLIKVDDQGNSSVFVSGTGTVQQMVWMPDGDLAVAADGMSGAVVRVTTAGAASVIKPNVYAYGLIMGPDDMLWAANYTEVMRIDPVTGGSETVFSSLPNGQPRVINFNRDFTRLYIGTISGSGGTIYYADLDANYDPIGGIQTLASGVGSGSYHDGLGVDICGYLYVPDYGTSALYRVSPAGNVSTLWDGDLTQYGHGLEWGNGVGAWREDALYLPQPYNGNHVVEIVIGVPTVFDGIVLNAPQP